MKQELNTILTAMTPEVYQRLATAVETGKWPDGVALTPEQREHAMQLVMLWQAQHNETPQHMTIGKGGEMVTKSKKQLKEEFGIEPDVTRIHLH
ncbi:YeaC family protein [Pantoea osteomyelitidis]|uniref:YeaC family protein n=1 Tax=Pantoea osteomyelitidis TaxID=3230026 RepID=A0ABW7PXH6_9GAMM